LWTPASARSFLSVRAFAAAIPSARRRAGSISVRRAPSSFAAPVPTRWSSSWLCRP
jgi:hypothetical protein